MAVVLGGFFWFQKNKAREAEAAVAHWTAATSTASWIVPAGVTEITVKVWGAGAGGGAGGGGGYVETKLTVTPTETLTIMVGGAGTGGAYTGPPTRQGTGGGGYSAVRRGATVLIQAGGGGGGGAGSNNAAYTGGAAGAGGGFTGIDGDNGAGAACAGGATDVGEGGGGGTQSAGGAGGVNCNSVDGGDGSDGSANQGGAGGIAGGGGAGGLNGGGAGGNFAGSNSGHAGGGGGGGGYYGGGGGERGAARAAGGGGGGSATSTGVNSVMTAGSGRNPANESDYHYTTYCAANAALGGTAGASTGAGGAGNPGCVVIIYNASAPVFTDNVVSVPAAGGAGDSVTFTGTSTDADGDGWYLAVCKTNSITPGSPPACATGETICVSSAAVSSGSANTCGWTVGSSPPGELNWYAFACDDVYGVPRCSSANTVNSPFLINQPGKSQVTLEDIYCKITGCTPASYGLERSGAAASTMYTLEEIYDAELKPLHHTSGWTPNPSGDGSTALTQAACEAAADWEWFEDANGNGTTDDPEDGICVMAANLGNTGSWNGYLWTTNLENSYLAAYTCAGNFPNGYVDTYSGIDASGNPDTVWADKKCALCWADCLDGKKDLPDQGGWTTGNAAESGGVEGPLTPEVLKNWKGTRLPTFEDYFGFCGHRTDQTETGAGNGNYYSSGASANTTLGSYGQNIGRGQNSAPHDKYINLSNMGSYEWLSEQDHYVNARVAGYNACSCSYYNYVDNSRRSRAVFRP